MSISRRDAVSLLEAGMKPGKIVTLAEPQRTLERAVKLKPTRLDALRKDLERYAAKEFEELEGEFTLEADKRQGNAKARSLYHLWHETASLYTQAIEGFRGQRTAGVEYDSLLRRSLDLGRWQNDGEGPHQPLAGRPRAHAERSYRVGVDVDDDGFGVVLVGETMTNSRPKRRHNIRVVGVQMRRDWTCRVQGGLWQSVGTLLSALSVAKHVVLVVLPWTPYHAEIPAEAVAALASRQERPDHTCSVVTPAAFSVMMSALFRDFTDGEEIMTLLSAKDNVRLFRFINLAVAHERLQTGSVAWPESIREKIVGHFEVDPSVSTETVRGSLAEA